MKKVSFIILLLLAACAQQQALHPTKLNVVASFYPLQFFTEQIGKDNVQVVSLVPPGVDVHDWEPTPQDIVRIQSSPVFIYQGIGEFWSDAIVKTIDKSKSVVIRTSDGITFFQDNETGQFDPHIWLDPVLVKQQVDTIAAGLSKSDPAHQEAYMKNAAEFKQRLDALDQEFKAGLSNCKHDAIITSHLAFRYITSRYGYKQAAISGMAHEEEPSAETIAGLVEYAKEHNIKIIFFETLLSPRVSETIANEIGGQTLVLNPIEGLTKEEIAAGENWLTVQEQNLKNMRFALECQ